MCPEVCIHISDERYRKLVTIAKFDHRYKGDEGKLVEELFHLGFNLIYGKIVSEDMPIHTHYASTTPEEFKEFNEWYDKNIRDRNDT